MVFLETSLFTAALADTWDDDEYARLQAYLSQYPEAGAVVAGTGGVRKVRWRASGRGKRGGARVVYYYANERHQIWLLMAYTTADQADLTPEQKRLIKAVVARWKGG